MFSKKTRNETRTARVRRIRATVRGTAERPRLAVQRSLRSMSAQLIDDVNGKTLAYTSDKALTGTPIEKAKQVGTQIAEAAKKINISQIVFDRAGNRYHGRVAALAEGAREAGLQF